MSESLEPKPIKTVLVFENGNIAVFNESGEQIPELQSNLICDWAEKATKAGYSVDQVFPKPGPVPLPATREQADVGFAKAIADAKEWMLQARFVGRRSGATLELSRYLRVNESSVRKWIKREKIPLQETLDSINRWLLSKKAGL